MFKTKNFIFKVIKYFLNIIISISNKKKKKIEEEEKFNTLFVKISKIKL